MTDLLTAPATAARVPGAEPLAGYRLLGPLGRGGFGEVWKCEAPGGLHKAIKFIPTGDGSRQELAAFEQIKSIRHPFLLTLERVEQVATDLVMVMELADGQLSDRFRECRTAELAGIPRDELLGYLRETAEALDMMGSKYGLQHLDVKPENIFVVSGHAKVGDYGLVRRAELNDKATAAGGFTPKYTPPEVLVGKVDIRSDQYSLALVYAELLTGRFPYPGRSAHQIMLQHIQGTPDLSGLPPTDRGAVERALAKDPSQRFPSCLAFVRELTSPDRPGQSAVIEFAQTLAPVSRPMAVHITPLPQAFTTGSFRTQAEVPTLQTRSGLTPSLVRPQDRRKPPPPKPVEVPTDPFADLTPVMPVNRLHQPTPRAIDPDGMPVLELVEAVVQAAIKQTLGEGSQKFATEQVQFLSTMPVHMMPYKLVIVAEQWGLSARHVDLTQVVLRKEDRDPGLKGGKPFPGRGGYEVTISLPAPPSIEVTASARMFGTPDRTFVKAALGDIPAILDQVRGQLQNLKERRMHPRHPFDTPVRVYPLFTDGQVGQSVGGKLIDVSLGGIRFVTPAEPGSDRLFVQFLDVPAISNQAVYTRVLRSHPDASGAGVVSVARFRRAQ